MVVGRMLGLGATGLKSNFVTLRHPYKLNFAITYWCQSRCVHCNIWQIRPKGELTLDEIREFARKNAYFKWIELTGGEPFLRGDIVEIARAFKENSKGLYILTMPTNSLCNTEMEIGKIKQILELGIPRVAITVSLDGYRELHDRIRGVPGNFDKAMQMFRRLRELRKSYPNLFFVFGYTMIKQNEGQFFRTFEGVKKEIPDIRYNDFHINLGQTSENYYHTSDSSIKVNGSELAAVEIRELLKKREFEIGVIPKIEEIFLRGLAQYAKSGKQPMRSRSMEASLFLDSWGNVYPSIMWNKVVGNIKEADFDLSRIWEGEDAKEVRKAIREGREPVQWTSCEAYQSIIGNVAAFVKVRNTIY
ncbi:MAG: radical SAM protein [Candidatus Micrarchaeota archaeon]|nr:radical SAM protein [Candidatus Micrarchaeota archaeon]MDE1848131.1 radical SAM protein [Candidatus Micrarchaeota archaeon]MDE1864786.1 radical SAM protein [Candidatus Micrarchaeota archaeon]